MEWSCLLIMPNFNWSFFVLLVKENGQIHVNDAMSLFTSTQFTEVSDYGTVIVTCNMGKS